MLILASTVDNLLHNPLPTCDGTLLNMGLMTMSCDPTGCNDPEQHLCQCWTWKRGCWRHHHSTRGPYNPNPHTNTLKAIQRGSAGRHCHRMCCGCQPLVLSGLCSPGHRSQASKGQGDKERRASTKCYRSLHSHGCYHGSAAGPKCQVFQASQMDSSFPEATVSRGVQARHGCKCVGAGILDSNCGKLNGGPSWPACCLSQLKAVTQRS